MITTNITAVNGSNKNPQLKFNNSDENHLQTDKQHIEPEKPTSKKINNDIIKAIKIEAVDKKREPFVPIKRPKIPQTKLEKAGINKIVKYIKV